MLKHVDAVEFERLQLRVMACSPVRSSEFFWRIIYAIGPHLNSFRRQLKAFLFAQY